MANETPASSRLDRVRAAAAEILEDLSGLSLSGFDSSATFLEMGFDSLFLTQVTQAIQSRFGLKIAFRQLLDRESTLDALAAYVEVKMPADKFPDAPSRPTAATPASPPPPPRIEGPEIRGDSVPAYQVRAVAAPAGLGNPPMASRASALETFLREQIQAMSSLMAKQLEILGGGSMAVELPSTPALAAAPPPAPAASPSPSSSDVSGKQAPAASDSYPTDGLAATKEFKPFGPYKPVQKGQVGDLTERQAHYLDRLIGRYTARTRQSKEFTQRHRRELADPRVAAGFRSQWKEMVYPIVTVRSRGSRLWDLDGNEYIDILNGFGPIMLGHAPDLVRDAIRRQLEDGFEIGPQTPLAGEVAALVCELTGMERATFCNTGSEAVMAAIRVARTVTGRSRIVLFAGAYHGTFDEVLVRGIQRRGEPHSLPIAPGIPPEKVAQVTVLNYGTPEALDYIRSHAHELAAVLVEPVQSRHPALQPVEFLRELRRITADSGAALIFDEVVTGFRVHPGGAQALFGIRSDLATYGKVVGGGMPIGILAGRSEYMDALDGGMWQYGDGSYPERGVTFFAGTFVRHPLALSAVHAVLTHLKKSGPGLQVGLGEKTSKLVQTLNAYLEERAVPTRIEHFSSIFYFSFPTELRFGSLLYYHLREKGVHIQEGFPCFLTTAHTDADIDHVVRAFKEGIAEMQEGGVLPEPPPRVGPRPDSPPSTATYDAGIPGESPLTEAQIEILLAARVSDEASCAFNESFTAHLRGSLDRGALEATIPQLVARHDALRGTVDVGRNRLRIAESIEIDVPPVDLASLPVAERAEHLERIVREDAATPFDLEGGPLVRTKLIRLEPDRHALLFTSHHLICDGWSTNVLLDEMSRLYAANRAGAAPDLPDPARFETYALAQAEWVRSPERAAVEAWWVEQFSTPVPPLELPTDRPRDSIRSFRGATARSRIDAGRYQRVRRFAAQQGCTLFATLMAAFKILLHRLTGQTDIVVGIPAAGQALLDAQSVVGHCVNFLPLRTSFEDSPRVSGLMARMKGTLLDAYEHQEYTYGSLVRRLALPRDPSRLPLVEVQFNLERVGTGLSFPGLEVEVDSNPKSFVNFDLFLNIVESDLGLVLDCDYNSDLFDRETVVRWLHHYETLLDEMIADPSREVSALSLLDDAGRRRLLVEWNETRAEYPRDKCIHHLFEDQAARTPDATAVVSEGRQLTYAELDEAANRLAHHLQGLGIGPETTVGICLERSAEMLVGLLAILKAGGAYVPLDSSYPAEHLAMMIEDSRPSLILTQEALAARLGTPPCRMVLLERTRGAILRESPRRPACSVGPQNLAYLIFTSGSTGRPKGVSIDHRCVVNLLWSMAREPGLAAEDTLLAVTTLSFDIAVLELFLPLAVGARVVLAAREDMADGYRLLSLMARSGATVMQATPATWRLLLEAGWEGSPRIKILCGGEALPRDLADALLARSPSVWNMYGPTETTVWSATARVEPGPGPVTIGPPIANTRFYVLDGSGRPAPVGAPGELHIGGDGLARGYWLQPRLTAERFVRDPFDDDPESRLYKTGDLVRYRPDGRLEFLGRLDSQVKVRGFRIEAAAVESTLAQYPGVRGCVVFAREDTPGDKRLVAYLVAEGATPAAGDLRRFLASRLPDYMVPTAFVRLDALPRTPNGKIDRRRLPTPERSDQPSDRGYAAPTNPRERVLAEICAEVLQVERVSVQDSLFDLGADSIQLFQVVARASEAGIALTPMQILAGRSVSAIVADLEGGERPSQDREVPQLVPVSRESYRTRRSRLAGSEAVDGRGQGRWGIP